MADLDPRKLEDLTRAIEQLTQAVGGSGDSFTRQRRTVDETNDVLGDLNDEARDSVRVATAENDARRASQQRINEENAARARNSRVMYDAERALTSLKNAAFSAEASFSKYNGAIEGSKGIIDSFTKDMGFMGKAIGFLGKAALTLAEKQLEQADNALKATDQLAKMGSAGQLTTKEVLEMGRQAGYASFRIESLIKPIQSMGSSVISLGLTAQQGQKAFAQMANVGQDVREKFRALGISQEELTQSQADYVSLQAKSGASMNRPIAELQKNSLEYIENLQVLSALTGKDIDTIKKEQELARSDYQTMIKQNQLDQQLEAAKKAGNTDEVKRIENEIKARNELLDTIQSQFGTETRREAAAFLATGSYTEASKSLLQLGIPMEKIAQSVKNGDSAIGLFADSMVEGVDRNSRALGYSAMYNEELAKQTGLTQEKLAATAQLRGKSEEERLAEIKKARDEAKTQEDTAQKARNLMLETENKLQISMDQLLQKTNPLIEGFNKTTSAVAALQVAALAAAAVLGAKAFIGGLSSIAGLGGTAAGGAAATGAGLAGAAGSTAAVLAAGAAGYAAGTYIVNPLLNKGAELVTGRKDETVGGALYEFVNSSQEEDAAMNAKQSATASADYNKALAGTGYTYDLDKGGLQKDNKRVPITEAPENIRAIVSRVYDERKKAPKMAIGGLLGSNQLGLVGEAGPEFITGPGRVVGVKDTEKLLGNALRNGLGPFTSLGQKSSSIKSQELTLERNVRNLNVEKEKELETLTETNELNEDLNSRTSNLTDTFKEFQDVLKRIFGGPEEEDFTSPEAQGSPSESGSWWSNMFGGGKVDPVTSQKAKESEEGKKALQFFIDQGWTKEQASGIVGNLMVESGANLSTTAVGDGGKAYGIAQWHPDRQKLFKRKFGKDIRESTLEEQLQFVQYELQNNEYKAGARLSEATTAQEAAAIIDALYERSSGAHRGRRVGVAQVLASDVVDKLTAEAQPETKEPAKETKPPTTEIAQAPKMDQNALLMMNAQGLADLSEKLSVMISKMEENTAIQAKIQRQTA